MSDTRTLATDIGAAVGGPENVTWMGSCTTRLRFVVRDESQVDFGVLNEMPGVLQAVTAGGQIQVVIGTQVDQVRDELLRVPGWARLRSEDGAPGDAARRDGPGHRRALDVVFDFLGGTFQPLIPVITGAAMVQVLTLLLIQFAGLGAEDPTALILTATGNAIFYFLPVFVAFTASRKLGANPFIGAAIAAALLHPGFVAIGETGSVTSAFGLPLFVYSYASSMFPALLLALALAGLDRLLKRWIPKVLQQVFLPTIELLLLVPLTALVFGPVGVIVGNGIGAGTQWLATNAPFVFYIIVPAMWFLLVALGIHWALISIAISDLAVTGSSAILGAAVGYQYAIMGIALGMLIRAVRNRDLVLRGTAGAATLAVAIGGITEPTIYGFLLRYRRLLVIELIGAGASGLVLGLFGAEMFGFSPAPFLGLPLMQPILGAVLAMVVAVVVPIVLIQVWGYEKKTAAAVPNLVASESSPLDESISTGVIGSPMTGEVRPLTETGEAVFAAGVLGPGVCIVPETSRIVAPFDGTVVALPPSAHAAGVLGDDGTEMLVHVGIDTVKLRGEHFTAKVEQGQRVRRGDVLLEFEREALMSKGISLITPVILTNFEADQHDLETLIEGAVHEGQPLLKVRTTAH